MTFDPATARPSKVTVLSPLPLLLDGWEGASSHVRICGGTIKEGQVEA